MSEELYEKEFQEEPLKRLKSLSPDLIKVLKDKGYYTIESLAVEAPHLLYETVGARPGFTLERAKEMVREARNLLKIEIISAKELLEICLLYTSPSPRD